MVIAVGWRGRLNSKMKGFHGVIPWLNGIPFGCCRLDGELSLEMFNKDFKLSVASCEKVR